MQTEALFAEKWKEFESATRLAFPTWDGHNVEKFLKSMRVEGVDFTRLMALRMARNALPHNPLLNGTPIVSLNSGVVPFLDDVISCIKKLPTAANILILIKNVFSCSFDDTISSIVDVMLKNVYSHVPVLDGNGRVVGVFSESTLLEMSKSGIGSVGGKRIRDIAEFLPLERHTADVFRFVPKNDPIAHLRYLCAEALERRERIGMIFVTENGNDDEALLGIITVWDIAGVSDVSVGIPLQISQKSTKEISNMDADTIVMAVKMTDDNTIAIGDLYSNGTFVEQYYAYRDQVDTEQKVLAWVNDLCSKQGIDQRVLKSFIECCVKMHPNLDVHRKG